jgi:hypothetical protein
MELTQTAMPRAKASHTRNMSPVSSIQNKGKAKSRPKSAPPMITARRPSLAESATNIGVEETSTPASPEGTLTRRVRSA